MPLDGIVMDCIYLELMDKLPGGRVFKIFQPNKSDVLLHVRVPGNNFKLLISANPNYPRVHLTNISKENPQTPPMFCMVLRKHLQGGKILDISFSDFERILTFDIESVSELGDLSVKRLIIEAMGRHSNIILVDSTGKIIDSIKHINKNISRVREVIPSKEYVLPPSQGKINPLNLNIDNLIGNMGSNNSTIERYLLNNIGGFSPFLCKEICSCAGIPEGTVGPDISENKVWITQLKLVLKEAVRKIKDKDYKPFIIYDTQSNPNKTLIPNNVKNGEPFDFHCILVNQYKGTKHFSSISCVLDTYYYKKDYNNILNQRISNLSRMLETYVDRNRKKLAIQQETLRQVKDREKLKLYGELITAFIYSIPKNSNKVSLLNYYKPNEEYVEIELNENKTPQENAQAYFKKYSKAKSAFLNASRQLRKTSRELNYLEGVLHLLNSCTEIAGIEEIEEELIEEKYISLKSGKSIKKVKKSKASSPHYYRSSDDFDIYVGKNNKQNDFLTFKFSDAADIWLHVKGIPGSHTIVKSVKRDLPNSTLIEAATIAAWHSKAFGSSNVPVDYTQIRYVKKPKNAKPGMVIYENFKTIFVTPDKNLVEGLKFNK